MSWQYRWTGIAQLDQIWWEDCRAKEILDTNGRFTQEFKSESYEGTKVKGPEVGG